MARFLFASSRTFPRKQATVSGHTISVGISDVVIYGSEYALPNRTAKTPDQLLVKFANGVVASPKDHPNHLQIGNHFMSADQPAFTISGATVAKASCVSPTSSSVPLIRLGNGSSSTGLGDILVSPSQDGNHSTSGNGSSSLNAVVFTGRISRSPYNISSSVHFCLDTRNGNLHNYKSGVVNAVLTVEHDRPHAMSLLLVVAVSGNI